MSRILALALALSVLAPAVHASEAATACNTIISAEGKSTFVEGSDDFETYNGRVPPDLAQRRAIAAWQSKVASACPSYSVRWWRSVARKIDCDSGMGKSICTVSAAPAPKLFSFSWLQPK
jgi:hypothetical protein